MARRDVIENILSFTMIGLMFTILFYFSSHLDNVGITGFAVFESGNQSVFDEGGYTNTGWNGNAVVLVGENLSGTYTSKIFDAGGEASWNNLNWTATDFGELLNNKQGNLMSGNVLLLHMNEASGTIEDTSGENNDGTYNGALYSQSGKLNTAIGFDGINDYINVSDSDTLSVVGDITLGAWIKPNKVVGYKNIIVKEAGANQLSYGLTTSPSDIYFWFYANSAYKIHETTSNFLDAGQWWNIVAVYDDVNNNVILYANGVEKYNSAETSSLVDYANSPLNIGWRNTKTANQRFNGNIDEVAIWDRALSPDEILDFYKRGITRLNLTARSCDDSVCSGESYSDIIDSSPQNLSLDNNKYFQYKFLFETDDNSYSPELESVSIDYSALDSSSPQISFSSSTTVTGEYNQDSIFVGVDVTDESQTYSFINFNNSLVGFWKMNDTEATIKDYSGYGNDGTNNGASSIAGKFGNALDFDGVSNKISCGTSQLFNFDKDDTYTLSAWIKTTDSQHPILGKMTTSPYPGYDLNVWNNKLRAHLVSSWSGNRIIVESTSLINDGTWTYVVATYDGSSNASGMKIYVNGQEESNIIEDTLTGSTINGANLEIGTRTAGGFLEGTIDEVLIFNRVLSSNEISALYNASSYSNNFTNLVDKSYDFYSYAQDSLGNENRTETRTVNLVSNVAPIINLIEPQNQLYTSNESLALNFSASDGDGNLDSCWYNLNGGSNISLTNCQNITFNISADGNYVLIIYVNDSEGLEANDSVRFNVDATGVNVSISEPTGTKTSRTAIPIAYSTMGNNLTCWYNVKTSIGGEVIINTTLPNCSSFVFEVSTDGNYVFNLYINNTLSSSDSKNSSFSVDTSTPVSPPAPVSDGGSGGGGGYFSLPTIINLELTPIEAVMYPREEKSLELIVKNNGIRSVNKCKLKTSEEQRSWVSSTDIKNIAAGEIVEFAFTLTLPTNEKYPELFLECLEGNESVPLKVVFVKPSLNIEFLEIALKNSNEILIKYSVESESDLVSNLIFSVYSDKEKIAEETQEIGLIEGEKFENEVILEIKEGIFSGLLKISVVNQGEDKPLIESSIVYNSNIISGFAVGELVEGEIIFLIIIISVFLIFAIIIIKKIIKNRQKKK